MENHEFKRTEVNAILNHPKIKIQNISVNIYKQITPSKAGVSLALKALLRVRVNFEISMYSLFYV